MLYSFIVVLVCVSTYMCVKCIYMYVKRTYREKKQKTQKTNRRSGRTTFSRDQLLDGSCQQALHRLVGFLLLGTAKALYSVCGNEPVRKAVLKSSVESH